MIFLKTLLTVALIHFGVNIVVEVCNEYLPIQANAEQALTVAALYIMIHHMYDGDIHNG